MAIPFASPEAVDRPEFVDVSVDCATHADYPLLKSKFALMNSNIVPVERYRRDIDLITRLRADSLRIDLGWGAPWGGWSRQPVRGTAEQPIYDFAEMDEIAQLLNAHDVAPYWSYCYTPDPLQSPPGEWRSRPSDMQAWARILAAFVAHHRAGDASLQVGYHEVHNEPDNAEVFFLGGVDDYLEMYRLCAPAIRAADPDAVVGGPALYLDNEWIPPLLDLVEREHLPFDFFSYHHYGDRDLKTIITAVRKIFAERPAFATTELHLNELNSLPYNYPVGGPQDHFGVAAVMLDDLSYLLTQPDVTLVSWAQFQDAGVDHLGLVDMEGHRKAGYFAFAAYMGMPIDRHPLSVQGPAGVSGLASSDAHRASVLLWNRADSEREVRLALSHVAFPSGTIDVYRIDEHHSSWFDDPETEGFEPVEHERVSTDGLSWRGSIPAGAVVYVEVSDGAPSPDLDRAPFKRAPRPLHYFPDRTSPAYAEFDRRRWIAWLGAAGDDHARAQAGVQADGLPDTLHVTVESQGDVPRRLGPDSMLGIRVDYHDGAAYSRAAVWMGPFAGVALFDPAGAVPAPWGTQQPADEVIRVADFSRFSLALREHAPSGWSGRVQISVIAQHLGGGARLKVLFGNSDA